MSKFYERYWEESCGHLGDFSIKWPKLSPLIPRESGITILDFGCGAGQILKEIQKINPGAKLIGLDVSEKALGEAKKELPSAEFHQIKDGEKVPIQDNSIDFIFSSEVIEHIYDTENAISEMSRILKPGGKLLITTPYHGFIKNLTILLSGKFDSHFDPIGPHVRFFSKRTLGELLQKFGFKIEQIGYFGRFYPLSHSIYVMGIKSDSR
jgi:2-polyprenyl-6-hydroxyphenyl methylase/3-demethylubiquinone-9 3-methyltransferase